MQNATLAGGVAVGAVADTVLYPWGALLVGLGSGILSVLGYRFITVSSSRDIGTVLSVLIVGVYSDIGAVMSVLIVVVCSIGRHLGL